MTAVNKRYSYLRVAVIRIDVHLTGENPTNMSHAFHAQLAYGLRPVGDLWFIISLLELRLLGPSTLRLLRSLLLGHSDLRLLGSLLLGRSGHLLLALVIQSLKKGICRCWEAEVPCKQNNNKIYQAKQ
jgi:hypothetical protein